MTPQTAQKPLSTSARVNRLAVAFGQPGPPLGDTKLAEVIGTSRVSVWRWRSGVSEPIILFLNRISDLEKRLGLD